MIDRRTGESPPDLSVHAVVPERRVDVSFALASGRVLALLGRNGAGKSTVLDAIVGLLDPEAGNVRVGARTLLDSHTWVPPHQRGVALLAQRPLLFPHMTVLENVAFGPRSARMPKRRSRALAREALAHVEMAEYAERRPAQLSGGQAQRIALARALAIDPRVILLDEPLAALDVDSAALLRTLLRTVLRDDRRTAIVVSHDVEDIRALADDVVVLEGGRVVEAGSAPEVLAEPRSEFLRRLVGMRANGARQAEPVHS